MRGTEVGGLQASDATQRWKMFDVRSGAELLCCGDQEEPLVVSLGPGFDVSDSGGSWLQVQVQVS